jgi:hypothetical protein
MVALISMVLQQSATALQVSFSFADRRHTVDTRGWWPDNHLQVGVNPATGYGGLVWYVSPDRAERLGDEELQYAWVTDNPNPPEDDPLVVSDPCVPMCFDRRSTLPIEDIRAALEEFCRTGTGDRPESVGWVHGDINGYRREDRRSPRS